MNTIERERLYSPDLKERLRSTETLLLDIDGVIFPGPEALGRVMEELSTKVNIIPCTTRSYTEAISNNYPGKEALSRSTTGIFEAGLVVVREGQEFQLGERRRWEQVECISRLLKSFLEPVGRRYSDNRYDLIPDPQAVPIWGFPRSILGIDYAKAKGVPLAIPEFAGQRSFVIWPSGSAKDCQKERDFYQIAFVIDGMMLANPKLFEGLSILLGEESIVIRPLDTDGREITKLTGVKLLESMGAIDMSTTLFMGDDDLTDYETAAYVRNSGGIAICPENAGTRIKTIADAVMPEEAGFSTFGFFQDWIDLSFKPEKDSKINRKAVWPTGQTAKEMIRNGLIVPKGISLGREKAEEVRQQLKNILKGNFFYAASIDIPEELKFGDKTVRPMVYINEDPFGYSDGLFTDIDSLIVFNDAGLINWLVEEANLSELALSTENLFVFPGNGGKYLKDMLAMRRVNPVNSLIIPAKRQLDAIAPWCKVDLPKVTREALGRIKQARRLIFVDDTISTGSTFSAIINELGFSWSWEPEETVLCVEALGGPRKKDSFLPSLAKFKERAKLYAPIFYIGLTQRPRLLTTGSIVDGLKNPERFDMKGYPVELIEEIRKKITD